MKTTRFDQLPYLCLRKIFDFLNLRDLAKCRAVNRQFKFYAEETTVDELVVRKEEARCDISCKWYQTDRPIDRRGSISPKAFASVKSSPFKLNQQLKFLHIHLQDRLDYLNYSSFLDSKLLSGFKQLVHLELNVWPRSLNRKLTLTLSNLKVLDVRSYYGASFVLKTPKLEVLAFRKISRIRAEHPETIKRIECDFSGENLATFKNLQVLVCHCFGRDLSEIRLSNWKDLRELQFQLVSLYGIDEFDADDEVAFEEFRSSLVNVMRQRTESKREELKLYVEEVLLVDTKQLEDYKTSVRQFDTSCLFRFKNYRQLRRDSYPDVTSVNFHGLMKLDVELSCDFFDRFPRIQRLTATDPVDQDRLEWFLQKATAVCVLILTNTSLDQTFLDRLPKINSQLTRLVVNGSSSLITNLNFVLQFVQLKTFKTDLELGPLDLAAKAFRQLNELKSFHFRAVSEHVQIRRSSPIKNDYTLQFNTYMYSTSLGIRTFFKKNLKWAELTALYDQRRAARTAGGEKAAKIKRARLQ